MAEIGIYFSSSTGNCANIAERIAKRFAPGSVEVFDIIHGDTKKLDDHSFLIFGIPTWESKQMHSEWEDFLPALNRIKLKRKRIALFGLGDQKTYSQNFTDGLGQLHHWLERRKAKIVGYWPTDSYIFNDSEAIVKGKFAGLVIDEDNQSDMSEARINKWTAQLHNEFYNE